MMNLLNFLKENKNARKIFGERELKIIEKQLQGVNLTQSEKNRLSRDIREKFIFIKDVGRFENEFELKKGRIVKEIIKDTLEIIKEDALFRQIDKIILFGSVVENKLSFRSDIDIAVKFFKINLKEATKFRIRISGSVNSKIDIQVYNILPEKIKKEINEKGKVIYEQNK
jgi:predicted nucleotidyltransferase